MYMNKKFYYDKFFYYLFSKNRYSIVHSMNVLIFENLKI